MVRTIQVLIGCYKNTRLKCKQIFPSYHMRLMRKFCEFLRPTIGRNDLLQGTYTDELDHTVNQRQNLKRRKSANVVEYR